MRFSVAKKKNQKKISKKKKAQNFNHINMMIFIFCFISIIVADHCHSKPTVTDDDQLGPYFVENLIQPNLNRILYDPVRDANAPKVIAHGIVTDRNCVHLSGVQVDLWGADQDGSYDSGLADGFMHGRNTVNQTGHFWFETILPARYVNLFTLLKVFNFDFFDFFDF